MKKLSRVLGLFVVGAGLIALNIGGSAGCDGTSTPSSGPDDGTVDATSNDALDTSEAAVNLALSAFIAAFGSSGAPLTLETAPTFKALIVATQTDDCNQVGLPSVSGDSITIFGDVSGDCEVTADGTLESGQLVADCVNYNAGIESADATIDGKIGVEGSQTANASQSTFDFNQISSDDLIVTLSDGSECSAVIDLSASDTVVFDTGEFTRSVSGCVAICGEAFNISGSESF